MADVEAELREAENERDGLSNTVSEMQAALVSAPPGARGVLERALQNASGKLGAVEKKIKDTRTELEIKAREQVAAISYQAQSEAALSATERKTFDGFLKNEYFTKADFGRLEDFYAKSWDRLSERGKDAMSERVWEGIRRDEYKFTDLPQVVQEKEAERAYEVLKKRETGVGMASRLPDVDRDDFIRAYESGDRARTGEVLDRKSFRENMFSIPYSSARLHANADRGQQENSGLVAQQVSNGPRDAGKGAAAAEKDAIGQSDFSSLNLSGVTAVESASAVNSAAIPNALASAPRER